MTRPDRNPALPDDAPTWPDLPPVLADDVAPTRPEPTPARGDDVAPTARPADGSGQAPAATDGTAAAAPPTRGPRPPRPAPPGRIGTDSAPRRRPVAAGPGRPEPERVGAPSPVGDTGAERHRGGPGTTDRVVSRVVEPRAVGRPARRTRLAGIDAARAVALVGMASVHILPVATPDGAATVAGAVAGGRASALFAVLAGVGVALSTGALSTGGDASPSGSRDVPAPRVPADLSSTSTRPASTPRSELGPRPAPRTSGGAAAGLLVRGVLVALVGLALVELDPPVAVILPYYGLLFALATPLLRLRAPVLAGLAAVWCVAGPVASHVLRAGRRALPGDQPGFAALAAPGDLLRELLLTGYYPVLPWLTYLLVGMAVGRLDLRSTRVAAALLAGGAVLAVAAATASALLLGPGGGAAVLGRALGTRRYGTVPTDTWWWLAVQAPHTGTPFDLAHTTGTALAALGVMLLLARAAPVLVWPLAAVGALPLTLYTLHVTALALYPPEAAEFDGVALGTLLVVHLVVALLIGAAMRAAGLRGPLEAGVGAVSGAVRRAVAG